MDGAREDTVEEQVSGREEVDAESGMVTVETALSMGSIMLVVLAVLVAIAAGTTHATVCHSARVAARAYSLGQDAASAATQVSARSVSVAVDGSSGLFTVRVTSPALRLGQWETLPITCQITAHREPFISWAQQ